MVTINLTALETILGGYGPVDSGTVSATYWAGNEPYLSVVGDEVRFPSEIKVQVIDGATVPLDMVPTRGVCCVRWVIRDHRSGHRLTRYTTIPDVPAIDFGDLVDVDPATFAPSEEGLAAWLAAIADVQAAAVAAGVARDESVSARTDAQIAAVSANESSISAALSATDAAGSASVAAGQAADAGAAAVDAAGSVIAAVTAREGAESARADAVSAAGGAEGSRDVAVAASDVAGAAEVAAVAAQGGAEVARDAAGLSASSAAGSATAAASAKTAAETARDAAQSTADGVPAAVAIALAAQAGKIIQGVGMPNGVVTATPGTLYVDTVSTMGASIWRKASGTGNTGWVVVHGDTGWRDITTLASVAMVFTGANRGIWIRRVNDVVTVEIRGNYSSPTTIFVTPTGFRSGTRYVGRGVLARHAPPLMIAAIRMVSSTGSLDISPAPGWTAGDEVSGTITFSTTDAWPTTLPGSPA